MLREAGGGLKIKSGELKVYYADELNPALDDAIEAAIKPFGYRLVSFGVNFNNSVRDLAFEKKIDKSPKK